MLNKDFINTQKLIQDQFKDLESKIIHQNEKHHKLADKIKILDHDIKDLNKLESRLKVEPLQRKMIMGCLTEVVTPIRRNFNVDLKNMRQFIEDCIIQIEENKEVNHKMQAQIKQISTQLIR